MCMSKYFCSIIFLLVVLSRDHLLASTQIIYLHLSELLITCLKMSMFSCKLTHPSVHIPSGRVDLPFPRSRPQPPKEKVVVVMGATGTGKSRLSIDLATSFRGEIVNSDKMQVYRGLDIITNKITEEECCGVPHHVLGIIHPNAEFTCTNFCDQASLALRSIASRKKLPIIVGGSNSYIEALIDGETNEFRSSYECCFLWVDVSMPVLHQYVSERVDRMVENGLVDEARQMFNPNADYSRGIRKAIGVPEFDHYFRVEAFADQETRARLCKEAINEVKTNTCKLACRQLEKIHRLKNVKGWKVHRLDATDVFLRNGRESDKAWDELVVGPSMVIVSRFLKSFGPNIYFEATTNRGETAMATATR